MNYHRRRFLQVFSCSCGALLVGACSKKNGAVADGVDYYTCTMHTSVHAPGPGKCPFCGMDLVPVMKNGAATAERLRAGRRSPVPVDRQQQIGVTYALVERKPLHHSIRAVGAVDYDMLRHWAFVARVDGYVQELDTATSRARSSKKTSR